MTQSISEQIRSRPDFVLNTKVFYKKHTWRVSLFQPSWGDADYLLKDAWYRNRSIERWLSINENNHYKTRSDSSFFVYLTRPDVIPTILKKWGEDVIGITGPISSKHQDIMLEDLQVVTRSKLWYNKYRYKISSQRHGQSDQEIFEDMQEFCIDTFEPDTYKLNDTFRLYNIKKQHGHVAQPVNSGQYRYKWINTHFFPFTATGSIYLVNHDDVVTLHMMYKKYITKSLKVITFDELE
jgi:hypothetical protein